jgi:hypothetical protein
LKFQISKKIKEGLKITHGVKKMRFLLALSLIAGAALAVFAQQAASPKAVTEIIASSEKIVLGAPFSAEAISESLQVLADGNRIARSSSNKMYRDAQGRFRREGISNPGTVFGAYFELQPTVLILDPVNGFKYFLNTDSKTVRRYTLRIPAQLGTALQGFYTIKPEGDQAVTAAAGSDHHAAARKLREELRARQAEVQAGKQATVAPKAALEHLEGIRTLTGQIAIAGTALTKLETPGVYGLGFKTDSKTEALGVQDFEGVEAEGTRTITTIPAGAIGNERPIDIVYERWYSKDLQLIVSSKHSDPRFGDQTYKLTNIIRANPDGTLFTLPADFKMLAEPGSGLKMTWPAMPPTPAPAGFPGRPAPKASPKPVVQPVPATKPATPPPAPKPAPKPVV